MRQLNYYRFFWLSLILTFFASGCATQGYDGVDTTRKAILVSTAEVRNANTLLQDLIRRNVVDDETAQSILQRLRDAHAVLQEALTAIDVHGDPFDAESKLAAANVTISIALSLLAEFTEG